MKRLRVNVSPHLLETLLEIAWDSFDECEFETLSDRSQLESEVTEIARQLRKARSLQRLKAQADDNIPF